MSIHLSVTFVPVVSEAIVLALLRLANLVNERLNGNLTKNEEWIEVDWDLIFQKTEDGRYEAYCEARRVMRADMSYDYRSGHANTAMVPITEIDHILFLDDGTVCFRYGDPTIFFKPGEKEGEELVELLSDAIKLGSVKRGDRERKFTKNTHLHI